MKQIEKKARFTLTGRNPDVLTCIANLSSDEVFTPPELANKMLDLVEKAWSEDHNGEKIWENPNVKILDPFSKSGVFLREATSRFVKGLEVAIPDLQERVDHILSKQVFGIAITSLTAFLSRRSLYCSKFANGQHSITKTFTNEKGNIVFEHTPHEWVGATNFVQTADSIGNPIRKGTNGKCKFCGAPQLVYERDDALETHAYLFIHTNNIESKLKELFGGKMQFDVVVGNPPYQLNDGGGSGSSASPIYQKFIEQAQSLEPRYLAMVIPSKWYSGGKGLDEFRSRMLADKRIRYIADFPDSREAFSGVDVAGGVCYFLWNRDQEGTCRVETFEKGKVFSADRKLDEYESFIRDNRALYIVKKVLDAKHSSFSSIVSSRKPFGIESAQATDAKGDCYLFASGKDGSIKRSSIPKGHELIDTWRVLISKTSSEHAGQTDKFGTKRLFSRIEVMPPGSVCTESYLVIGPFKNKTQSKHAAIYLKTRFVRFLVSTILLTQNISKSMFEFVPIQDFSRLWTDEQLYEKYGLTVEEQEYIESVIRPMNSQSDSEDE